MINDNIEPLPVSISHGNSQAVLSALKSLQDKIKRLEAERDAQARQCQELHCKLEVAKAETELAIQRERTAILDRERQAQHTIQLLTAEKEKAQKDKEVAESTVLACSKDVARLQQEVQRLHEVQRRELREQDTTAARHIQEVQKELQQARTQYIELETINQTIREELELVHKKKLIEQEELRRRSAEDVEHVRQATESRVTARVLELEAQLERERQRSEAFLHQKRQVESTLNDLVKLHAALTQRVAVLGHIPTKGEGRRRCRPSSSGPARSRSPTSASLAKRSERHPSFSANTSSLLVPSSAGLHDTLRKVGLLHSVPFVPVGTAGESFHAVATAQRALDISVPREAEPTAGHSHHCHHNDDGVIIDDSRVELRRLCDQLEEEYTALQAKYLDILHQVQKTGASGAGTDALTSSMNALLMQMNAKGDQLRRVRMVDTSLGSSRVSPPRRTDGLSPRGSGTIATSIARRTKTLQAFSELREMQQAR
eukprot:TRINITY_DN12866_c0_g1_i2.p1 TRINITY_DN12866_c0_g1~~TRINITY_DN12866_c0_g1_i2.p1  ORF type:complete len:487 (-),score=111.19 TRINITY_DN12866_c0_g1_i2:226-1686(-)